MSAPFGTRLQQAVADRGPLVVGIDPHPGLLEDWGLPDSAEGLRAFSRAVLDACDDEVCALKPQSAFFERHGSAGIAVLEDLLSAMRERAMLSILDVKRGDIGSTMTAYAEAYLRPGSPLEADAITLSPYLGLGSLEPALTHVRASGKGMFVLALTSNPEGPQVQHARAQDGTAVAAAVTEFAAKANLEQLYADGLDPEHGWGSTGLVVGATVGDALGRLGIDVAGTRSPVLAPGFGAQGAGPAQRAEVFGAAADRVLVSISRGVLAAGPDPGRIRERVRALRTEYSAP